MYSSPKEIIEEFVRMKGTRSVIESHVQECAEYFIPMKGNITKSIGPGAKVGINLYDTTGQHSAELLAGQLHGMLTNPAAQWFELSTGDDALDEDDEVRLWMQDTAHQILNTMNNSNFQTESHELYVDIIWAGTSTMVIEEDDVRVIRFGTRSFKESYLKENNKGFIDCVWRSFEFTARQLIQEYGEKGMHKVVLDALRSEPDKKFEVIHAVFPRNEKKTAGKAGPKSYAFASVHVLVSEAQTLKDHGYKEFPYVCPRWMKVSGETYGRSPGMTALPDVKMVNEMAKTTLEGAQKVVNPPVSLPDDGFILPLKLKANGVNFRRSGNPEDKIEPIFNETRIDFGYQVMEDTRKRIRECFYVNQLQLGQGGPQMTATEVNARQEENFKFMGPMLGRMNSEFLTPMIDRIFAIMLRKKLFKPMPKQLAGRYVSVRYSSPVARAQRLSDASNIGRALQAAAPLIQLNPDAADIIDAEAGVREITKIFGVTQKMIRSKEDIEQIRQGKADAKQQIAQQEEQMQMAEIANKTAPAIANILPQKGQVA